MKPIDVGMFTELHKRIGLALWAEQSLEHTICHFIALILKLPSSRDEAEMVDTLGRLQRQTLGPLIKELRKGNTSNSITEFDRRMNAYLEDRNWLVHRSWLEHHADLFSPEKLPPLLDRLERIAQESQSLREYFAEPVERWTLQQPGVTKDALEADVARRLRASGVLDLKSK
jgi:hypothetical protein